MKELEHLSREVGLRELRLLSLKKRRHKRDLMINEDLFGYLYPEFDFLRIRYIYFFD